MDRAHRLGQTRIMGLQRFKLDVANAVVNTDNASLASMDMSQVLDLFGPPGPSVASKHLQGGPASDLKGGGYFLHPVLT